MWKDRSSPTPDHESLSRDLHAVLPAVREVVGRPDFFNQLGYTRFKAPLAQKRVEPLTMEPTVDIDSKTGRPTFSFQGESSRIVLSNNHDGLYVCDVRNELPFQLAGELDGSLDAIEGNAKEEELFERGTGSQVYAARVVLADPEKVDVTDTHTFVKATHPDIVLIRDGADRGRQAAACLRRQDFLVYDADIVRQGARGLSLNTDLVVQGTVVVWEKGRVVSIAEMWRRLPSVSDASGRSLTPYGLVASTTIDQVVDGLKAA